MNIETSNINLFILYFLLFEKFFIDYSMHSLRQKGNWTNPHLHEGNLNQRSLKYTAIEIKNLTSTETFINRHFLFGHSGVKKNSSSLLLYPYLEKKIWNFWRISYFPFSFAILCHFSYSQQDRKEPCNKTHLLLI